jgi:hypothetical protein
MREHRTIHVRVGAPETHKGLQDCRWLAYLDSTLCVHVSTLSLDALTDNYCYYEAYGLQGEQRDSMDRKAALMLFPFPEERPDEISLTG